MSKSNKKTPHKHINLALVDVYSYKHYNLYSFKFCILQFFWINYTLFATK